ncbi:thermonuclease family protein [Bhargavaea ginsengi]|uniref:thermonuclease family protein n=1 Tax=Bhargavaea ginsengi TaxID=426757 RepID=UPI00203A4F8F|nr:thermonuclease family protein [Bhargavaea ginsengi]MCM3088518.1 thermonuclease family protein [Bhargavaea ginsengi]
MGLRFRKRVKYHSKAAPAILLIGLALFLTGCGETVTDEDVMEEETEQVQTEESSEPEKKPEETAPANDETPEKTAQAKPEEQAAKEETEPAKKPTETGGTTAHIPVELVKTIDGDTIKIRYNGQEENVRYLLIDTPETSHPRLGKQPFGEQAKERNRELVNSGELSIEFDIGDRTDKYGRLLAYVYVNGKSVQETLLREGLARVGYVYPPSTRHLTPFEAAEAEAKAKKVGIWSIEDYATDSGFDTEASGQQSAAASAPVSTSGTSSGGGGASGGTNYDGDPSAQSGTTTERFKNCTELRTKYPDGVPAGHPAYQSKMDRDKDNYACE